MSKQLTVSTRFESLADEFNEHDRQAGQSFVAMINTQEEAKLEYQETTGKVHGFNEAWSGATGKPIKTVEQYNWLANKTVGLRKNSTAVEFSGFLSKDLLQDYASASPEAQEYVEQKLEAGESVSPKQIREWDATPVEVEKWDEDELREALKQNPVKAVVYGVEDIDRLGLHTLGGGLLLRNIFEHIDIAPEQFAPALAKWITHDGNTPRSAFVAAEFAESVDKYIELLIEVRGLIDVKPTLKVV